MLLTLVQNTRREHFRLDSQNFENCPAVIAKTSLSQSGGSAVCCMQPGLPAASEVGCLN